MARDGPALVWLRIDDGRTGRNELIGVGHLEKIEETLQRALRVGNHVLI